VPHWPRHHCASKTAGAAERRGKIKPRIGVRGERESLPRSSLRRRRRKAVNCAVGGIEEIASGVLRNIRSVTGVRACAHHEGGSAPIGVICGYIHYAVMHDRFDCITSLGNHSLSCVQKMR
jgi:hypothetical protein